MTTRNTSYVAGLGQMARMALRYLSGRKLRTALTTLAIVFGVALIFAINLVLPSMVNLFKQSLTSINGADLSITSVSGESFAPNDVLSKVAAVPGVTGVTGVLRRQFSLPSLGGGLGKTAQIELIGIDPTEAQKVRQFAMSDGRFLEAGDSGKAVLPAGIAELAPQLKVGATFPLITAGGLKLYTVVGLLADRGTPSAPEVYVTLAGAQAAFNQPGLINNVEVSVDANADRAAVTDAIKAALGSSYALNSSNDGTEVFASLQIGLSILNLMGVLALFLGAFLIFNTFRAVVIERRHDLGMLRAIGATRRQISQLILIESLIQGIGGTVIGLLLGYLMSLGLVRALGSFMQTLMNRSDLQLQFNASAVIVSVVMGLVTALLAGYFPARAAGRTSPLEALRPASTANVQRTARWSLIVGLALMAVAVLLLLTGSKGAISGALLFLMGMVVAAPGLVIPLSRLFSPLLTLWFAREGDLARGNLQRQPGRAAITGSTLMIGLAVLVLMAALVSGFAGLITNLANRNFSSDIILLPPTIAVYNSVVGANQDLENRLKALPNVAAVGSLRYANATVNGQALQMMGIDPDEYPKVASFDFSDQQPEAAFGSLKQGRNLLLTSIGLNTLKLQVGNDITLQTPNGPQTYHIAGVANDLMTFKVAAAFISQANMAEDFHKTEDIMLMMTVKPGADKSAVLAQVNDILKDYPQFTAHLTGEYKDDLMKTSSSAFVAFYGLAILILIPAALGLVNTLTINILERTREIGVVRAVGGSRGQVRRIVTGEALLLGIFGAATGVLVGVAISYGFVAAMGTIGWQMPYEFPLMGIIAAIIVGVIVALFASILPARSAARLEIIRALQYE